MIFLYDVVPLSGIYLQSRKWVVLGLLFERGPCKQRHPPFLGLARALPYTWENPPTKNKEALIRVRKKHVFSLRNKDKFPLWYRYESLGA